MTNEYLKNTKRPKCKPDNSESLSSLVNIPLTQSECIKLGTHIEKIFAILLSKYEHVENIRQKNKKGVKERDHLFVVNGVKVYAELKSNLNLDTEKRNKTIKKVIHIAREEKCEGYLLALRYYSCIPEHVRARYEGVRIVSVSEYFRLFGVPCPFFDFELGYKIWVNQLARGLIYNVNENIRQKQNEIVELTRLKKSLQF